MTIKRWLWKNCNTKCQMNDTFAGSCGVVVRLRTTLGRRVRRLDSDAFSSVTSRIFSTVNRFIETVAEADGCRHVVFACLIRWHHLRWVSSFSVDHFHDVDTALLRRCRPTFDLLATPWSILVVGMLLQMDHSKTFGFLYVRSSILRRETLPLFAYRI